MTVEKKLIPLKEFSGAKKIGPSVKPETKHLNQTEIREFFKETLKEELKTSDKFLGNIRPFEVFGFIGDLLRGIDVIEESEEKIGNITYAEIHRPHIKGCETTYNQGTTNTRDKVLELTIFGVGLQFGTTTDIGSGYECVADKYCGELLLGVKYKTQTYTQGRKIKTREKIIEFIEDDHKLKPIPEGKCLCGMNIEEIRAKGWKYNTHQAPEGFTPTIKYDLKKGKKFNFKILLKSSDGLTDIGNLNASFNITKTHGYKYKLAALFEYYEFTDPNKIWDKKQPDKKIIKIVHGLGKNWAWKELPQL